MHVLNSLKTANYKTLMKEIEMPEVNGRITYIHGSEESTMSEVHCGQNGLDLSCASGPN